MTDQADPARLRPAGSGGSGMRGTWRPYVWRLLPVALFLLLVIVGWVLGPQGGHPSWLARATAHALEVEEKGVGFLRGLDPVSDPRVGTSALLLLLGFPVAAILPLMRVAGILMGVTALLLVGRRKAPGPAGINVGAWFLAASPLWTQAALQGDPILVVGLLFFLFAHTPLPRAVQVVLLGWVLGWSPWAWIALPLLALWTPMRRGRSGAVQGATVLILSFAALWVLNPLSLMDPGGWLSGMIREAHVQRLLSTQAPIGVHRGLYPITQGLHIPGLILLIVAGVGWAAQCRGGNLAPLICLVLLLLGVRSGFASDAPLLILMPWAACEVGQGWGVIAGAVSKRLRHGWSLRLLPLLLILPLLAVTAGRWEMPSREVAGRASAVAWLEENLEPGSLVVHDATFAAPDSSRLVWLGVPFHSTHPSIYRGTYWTGWYRAARAVVVSEQLVMRFLRQPREGREMLDFYMHLTRTADDDRAFGHPAGRRTRVLLFSPEKGEALAETWRERVAAGAASGLPGVFLASLGAGLTQAGRAGAAANLLEESLSAGYDDVGIWMNLANAHLAFDRTMEAGRVLDEACIRHPDSWQLKYNLGLVLTRAGLWERSVRTLARVQREWPRSASVAYLLGLSLANDGRPKAARLQLERSLELDVDLPERERAEELLELLSEQGR